MIGGPSHGGGRRDDLRTNAVVTGASRGKLINRRFIETGDRSKGTGNEVQFVLDDKIGRIQRPAVAQWSAFARLGRPIEADAIFETVNMPKKSAGLTDPGQRCELVDRSDSKRRKTPVDGLVDRKHGQRSIPAELTAGVGAPNFQIGRRVFVWRAGKRCRRELGSAPRTSLERGRRALVTPVAIAPNSTDRCCLVRLSFAAQLVRRRVGADPQTDLDWPVTEHPTTALIDVLGVGAHQFERADDTCRARELVERQKAQGVTHDNGDASAEHARSAQPPMRNHQGREPEIGLGLAAARWKKQEVRRLTIDMSSID